MKTITNIEQLREFSRNLSELEKMVPAIVRFEQAGAMPLYASVERYSIDAIYMPLAVACELATNDRFRGARVWVSVENIAGGNRVKIYDNHGK